jgi:hypothetical protein
MAVIINGWFFSSLLKAGISITNLVNLTIIGTIKSKNSKYIQFMVKYNNS